MFYVDTVLLEKHILCMEEEAKHLRDLKEYLEKAEMLYSDMEQQILKEMEKKLEDMEHAVECISGVFQNLFETMLVNENIGSAKLQKLENYIDKIF